jgi:uroporphyrin-III C-methyltransferase/precorrin-2 dehydrogenase/sirohydrochlorin ferrochelatase
VDYLPVFVAVRGQQTVVVGGGEVAERKVSLLREAGAKVRVVAPELCAELAAALAPPDLTHVAREYERGDLDGARVVIAATDRMDVNARVAADAQQLGVLVNVVDQPALCGFVMPSIIDRAPVLVAVSTGGASPVLARLTRSALEAALPVRLGELADFAARRRDRVKAAFGDVASRRAFWERALAGEPGQLVLAGRVVEAERAFDAALARGASPPAAVAVIGSGAGDPEQLSLAAARALGRADLVVHELATAHAVLALCRRDALRHALRADAVLDGAALDRLTQVARAGGAACIVRAGDPYASGGASDARVLAAAGLASLSLRPAPVA